MPTAPIPSARERVDDWDDHAGVERELRADQDTARRARPRPRTSPRAAGAVPSRAPRSRAARSGAGRHRRGSIGAGDPRARSRPCSRSPRRRTCACRRRRASNADPAAPPRWRRPRRSCPRTAAGRPCLAPGRRTTRSQPSPGGRGSRSTRPPSRTCRRRPRARWPPRRLRPRTRRGPGSRVESGERLHPGPGQPPCCLHARRSVAGRHRRRTRCCGRADRPRPSTGPRRPRRRPLGSARCPRGAWSAR